MIEYVIMVIIVLGAIITLMQKDLLKAAVVSGITGLCVAFLYEILYFAPENSVIKLVSNLL